MNCESTAATWPNCDTGAERPHVPRVIDCPFNATTAGRSKRADLVRFAERFVSLPCNVGALCACFQRCVALSGPCDGGVTGSGYSERCRRSVCILTAEHAENAEFVFSLLALQPLRLPRFTRSSPCAPETCRCRRCRSLSLGCGGRGACRRQSVESLSARHSTPVSRLRPCSSSSHQNNSSPGS